MKSKAFVVALFLLLVMLPCPLTAFWLVSGKRLDCRLFGYFDAIEKPSRSLRAFLSGENQKRIEKALRAKICPGGFFIKLACQIQFSLFRTANRIIGKSDSIFELAYINAACGLGKEYDFSLPQNQKKIDEYVAHLQGIQQKLQKLGKTFIFYTTLSKGVENYDDIPFKYRFNAKPNLVTGYDYLKSAIAKTDVNYLDSRDYIGKQGDAPLFYNSGIHWSRPIEQVVSKALVEKMAALSGKNLPQIELGELHSSKTPFWRDDDVWKLVNIFQKPDFEYFEREMNLANCESGSKIFCQGGSFGQGFLHDYDKAADIHFCFYKNFVSHHESEIETPSIGEWTDLNLAKYLGECDFFLVEMNEAVVSGASNGFVEYFDKFLDGYSLPKTAGASF